MISKREYDNYEDKDTLFANVYYTTAWKQTVFNVKANMKMNADLNQFNLFVAKKGSKSDRT